MPVLPFETSCRPAKHWTTGGNGRTGSSAKSVGVESTICGLSASHTDDLVYVIALPARNRRHEDQLSNLPACPPAPGGHWRYRSRGLLRWSKLFGCPGVVCCTGRQLLRGPAAVPHLLQDREGDCLGT